jgi:hypothetical protein
MVFAWLLKGRSDRRFASKYRAKGVLRREGPGLGDKAAGAGECLTPLLGHHYRQKPPKRRLFFWGFPHFLFDPALDGKGGRGYYDYGNIFQEEEG